MTPNLERRKRAGEAWETVPVTDSPGGSQTLADVLANGADANGVGITNLPDGVNPQDAATVAQLGGSQPGLVVYGPIPLAFNSPAIGTTGFPVLDLLEGDIVCGWGVNITIVFNCDDPHLTLRMPDSGGIVTVNGGNNSLANLSSGDADAITLDEVFDGWTLSLHDQPLVAYITDTTNGTTGEADLYIAIMRPVAAP